MISTTLRAGISSRSAGKTFCASDFLLSYMNSLSDTRKVMPLSIITESSLRSPLFCPSLRNEYMRTPCRPPIEGQTRSRSPACPRSHSPR